MQWDESAQGGFTTSAKPWLPVNPNYATINAKQETVDPDSVYHYYGRAIALRAKTPALVYGDFKDLDPPNPAIFAYTRTLGTASYLVVLNFSGKPAEFALPEGVKAGRLVLGNLPASEAKPAQAGGALQMQPWEARVYQQ